MDVPCLPSFKEVPNTTVCLGCPIRVNVRGVQIPRFEEGKDSKSVRGRLGLFMQPHMGGVRPWLLCSFNPELPPNQQKASSLDLLLREGEDPSHYTDLGETRVRGMWTLRGLKVLSTTVKMNHMDAMEKVVGPLAENAWFFGLLLPRRKSGCLRSRDRACQLWVRL